MTQVIKYPTDPTLQPVMEEWEEGETKEKNGNVTTYKIHRIIYEFEKDN